VGDEFARLARMERELEKSEARDKGLDQVEEEVRLAEQEDGVKRKVTEIERKR